jgi:hypothetical protein
MLVRNNVTQRTYTIDDAAWAKLVEKGEDVKFTIIEGRNKVVKGKIIPPEAKEMTSKKVG